MEYSGVMSMDQSNSFESECICNNSLRIKHGEKYISKDSSLSQQVFGATSVSVDYTPNLLLSVKIACTFLVGSVMLLTFMVKPLARFYFHFGD